MDAQRIDSTPTSFETPAGEVSETAAPRRRSRLRRVARALRWIALGTLALALVALAFVNTRWGKELVRQRVEAALQAKVNGRVSLGSIDYGFLFGDLELGDLVIEDAAGDRAVAVASVRADLDRMSLVAGAPVLHSLSIDGLELHVTERPGGGSNLSGLMVPGGPPPDKHLRIERLSLGGAAITVRKVDGTEIELTGLSAAGSLDADPARHAAQLALQPTAAEARIDSPLLGERRIDLAIGPVRAAIRGTQASASIAALRLGPLAVESITASGKIEGGHLVGEQRMALEGVRVGAEELAALAGRPLLAGDLTFGITVAGEPEAMKVSGGAQLGGAALSIDGAIDARDLGAPGYRLAVAAKGVSTSAMLADRQAAPNIDSELALALEGHGIPGHPGSVAELRGEVGATAISLGAGRRLDVDQVRMAIRADGRAVKIDELVAAGLGLEVEVSGELSADRDVTADVSIAADTERATRELGLFGIALPRLPGTKRIELRASARGNLDRGLDVDLPRSRVAFAGGALGLGGSAHLESVKGRLTLTSADLGIAFDALRLGDLAALAGRPPRLAGALSGRVSIARRGARRTVDYDLSADLAEPALEVRASGRVGPRRAALELSSQRAGDAEPLATLSASLPLLPRGAAAVLDPDGAIEVHAQAPRRTLDELLALAPAPLAARLRQRLAAGDVAVRLDLGGTARAPRGTLAIDARGALRRLGGRAAHLAASIDVAPASRGVELRPHLSARIDGVDGALAALEGRVAVGPLFRGGRPDAAALRRAELGLALDLPERAVATLAPLAPALADLPGTLRGRVAVTGTASHPRLYSRASWSGFESAGGAPGRLGLVAAGSPERLAADLSLGARGEARIEATLERAAGGFDVRARARADAAPIARLLPAFAAPAGVELGRLDWNMDAEMRVANGAIERAAARGALEVAGGAVAIPGSERRYRDVDLRVEAAPHAIRIARLEAHESDAQRADRSISIRGELGLADRRPDKLSLDVRADDWLVWGGSMGQSDAPRASLDADIGVAVDLSRPIPSVDATVRSLDLSSPDRYDRAHQLESLSPAGDIMFVGDRGVVPGKLGRKRSPAAPRRHLPMDIRVHIPRPVAVESGPLSAHATGELTVTVRENGARTRGVLTLHDGSLSLFGHPHALERGRIVFDEAHPHGGLDLVFARKLPAATLRQLSRKSGGDAVRVTLTGPLAAKRLGFSGAAGAGFLDVLSAENAGRGLYHTEPGLAASASAQAPRGDQPLVMTFIEVNLPHMQMFDRFSAWSDPSRERGGYSRVDHLEAERTDADRAARLRVVSRPPELGRSRAEVQLDHLFVDDPQIAAGAGVRAGSRGGGGVGVFLEYSSKD